MRKERHRETIWPVHCFTAVKMARSWNLDLGSIAPGSVVFKSERGDLNARWGVPPPI